MNYKKYLGYIILALPTIIVLIASAILVHPYVALASLAFVLLLSLCVWVGMAFIESENREE